MAQTKNRIIVHLVSNNEWGGGERYALDIANSLLENGDRVLIACRSKAVADHFIEAGHEVKMMPLKGFVDIVSPLRLWWSLRKEGRAVIHVHNFKDAFTAAIVKCFRREVRLVMTRHLVKPSKNSALYRFIYQHIDKLIFVSRKAQSAFNSTANSLSADKQCVVLNGVKANTENGAVLPTPFACDVPVMMYHGRLSREKGVDILIKAAARVDLPFRLVIVGSGDADYTKELHDLVRLNKIDNKVVFLGFRKDAVSLAAKADFGVLPTVVAEACGFANIEYMMQGKAQIASNNGGPTEYLTDGETAFLVPANDIDALADKMRTLLSDPDLCRTMGERARAYFVNHLSYDRFFENIYETYNTD